MDPKTIYCHGEAAEFPVEQFRRNKDGSLHMPYIHDIDPPHWATNGEPLKGDSTPGVEWVPFGPPDVVAEEE